MIDIKKRLFLMQDLAYRDFTIKLIPNISIETVIGVRAPNLRNLANELLKSGNYLTFLDSLPHKYYEENNLHAFILKEIKDYDECIEQIEKFLPYIDNWATCDSLRPKIFKKHLSEVLEKIKEWIQSDNTYVIRFGIEMLMCYYLDDAFDNAYPKMVAGLKSNEYYVNMMIAWYFEAALVKQYESVIPYLEKHKLSKWVHNKTIQKTVESFCFTDEQKKYLRSLKL